MANALNWFEIPAADLKRAVRFYNTIFEVELTPMEATSGFTMAMFPVSPGEIGGAVVQGEGYAPSKQGTVVYLNGGENLSVVLDRVKDAGGQVLMPKTDIGEYGFMAYFEDTEGNKVGLHSMG